MTELKKLEQELSEKEKTFDERYISGKGDYLSEEAEKMSHDIWRLRSKIADLKEKKEKTADELFEELGYEIINNNKTTLNYEKEGLYMDKEIVFALLDKIVTVGYGTGECCEILMLELQAINKKVEELGWRK